MKGYQPKEKCTNCLAFNICTEKHKNKVCEKYKECRPAPPKTLSNAQTPIYTPPPMPEVKPPKQRTVLSVRDFAILMNIANMHIDKLEHDARHPFNYRLTEEERKKRVDENLAVLRQNIFYQDLLRIRDKLGELNIEVETPSVEVEE